LSQYNAAPFTSAQTTVSLASAVPVWSLDVALLLPAKISALNKIEPDKIKTSTHICSATAHAALIP
jgi:hypothetical protein